MKKFYCNNCDKDVELVDGRCPICNTNWKTLIEGINDEIDNSKLTYNTNWLGITSINENNDSIRSDNTKEKKKNKLVTDNTNDNKENYNTDEEDLIDDIEDTYNYFLRYAKYTKYCFFALAGIVLLASVIMFSDTDGASLILILVSLCLIGSGIFVEKNFKWKAYMLQTNYNKSIRKKR